MDAQDPRLEAALEQRVQRANMLDETFRRAAAAENPALKASLENRGARLLPDISTPMSRINPNDVGPTFEDMMRVLGPNEVSGYPTPSWDRPVDPRVLQTIIAEAGNQGEYGLAAVAHSIDNRVDRYGLDPAEVVVERRGNSPFHQYSAWNDTGRGGNDVRGIGPDDPRWDSADRIYRDVRDNAYDFTFGATHYYNPDIANPNWADPNVSGTERRYDALDIEDHRFLPRVAPEDRASIPSNPALRTSIASGGLGPEPTRFADVALPRARPERVEVNRFEDGIGSYVASNGYEYDTATNALLGYDDYGFPIPGYERPGVSAVASVPTPSRDTGLLAALEAASTEGYERPGNFAAPRTDISVAATTNYRGPFADSRRRLDTGQVASAPPIEIPPYVYQPSLPAKVGEERLLPSGGLSIAAATPAAVAPIIVGDPDQAYLPLSELGGGPRPRPVAVAEATMGGGEGPIDGAPLLPGMVPGARPAEQVAAREPTIWDNVVDMTGSMLDNSLLGMAAKNFFPDAWYGAGEAFKGNSNGGGTVDFGRLESLADNGGNGDTGYYNPDAYYGGEGGLSGFIDANGNGIDDRLEGYTPPAPVQQVASLTPRNVSFPDMPPYRPGIDNEWRYFTGPGYAEGGLVDALPMEPEAAPANPSPFDGMDPRVAIIAAAEDALEGESADPETAIAKFVETFGEEALEQLAAQVKAGMSLKKGKPRVVEGPGGPTDDAVPAVIDGTQPAALSSGEVVIPADAVAAAGDGDPYAGADRLMQISEQLAGKAA